MGKRGCVLEHLYLKKNDFVKRFSNYQIWFYIVSTEVGQILNKNAQCKFMHEKLAKRIYVSWHKRKNKHKNIPKSGVLWTFRERIFTKFQPE